MMVLDQRIMNEDWRTGDLAECISDNWAPRNPFDPIKGNVYRVVRVGEGVVLTRDVLVYALTFEGKPANHGWPTTCFRKLRPTICECSDGWAEWLQGRIRAKAGV